MVLSFTGKVLELPLSLTECTPEQLKTPFDLVGSLDADPNPGKVLADDPGAQNLADKLRRAASGVRAPWDSGKVTLSAGIVEAVAKSDYDSEDIVTDLINRAEFSVEEARKRGGDVIVLSAIPKV